MRIRIGVRIGDGSYANFKPGMDYYPHPSRYKLSMTTPEINKKSIQNGISRGLLYIAGGGINLILIYISVLIGHPYVNVIGNTIIILTAICGISLGIVAITIIRPFELRDKIVSKRPYVDEGFLSYRSNPRALVVISMPTWREAVIRLLRSPTARIIMAVEVVILLLAYLAYLYLTSPL